MEAPDKSIQVAIPSQGVDLTMSPEEAVKFFDREIKFYRKLQSTTDVDLVYGPNSYGAVRLSRSAVSSLTEIKKEISGGAAGSLFEAYIKNANELRHLVGQGLLGERIDALLEGGNAPEAKWIAYATSPAWLELANDRAAEILSSIRASLLANPSIPNAVNLTETKKASETARQSEQISKKAADEMEAFRQEKATLFADLEDLYRRKLVLEEPAILWDNIAAAKTLNWRIWLSVFFALLAIPATFIVQNYELAVATVARITSTANGGVSISGIAAISVPALFYAWLLKNISRVFLQNLNLADDATHRRALALTYLGLAANPKLDVSENDRALILNALFRPIPSQGGDEGPPSGLLDLIRKKE